MITETIAWLYTLCCFGTDTRQVSGIGVTLYSDYPNSDAYYRLRQYGDRSFHIAPHPDGTIFCLGDRDTGVRPRVNHWQ